MNEGNSMLIAFSIYGLFLLLQIALYFYRTEQSFTSKRDEDGITIVSKWNRLGNTYKFSVQDDPKPVIYFNIGLLVVICFMVAYFQLKSQGFDITTGSFN